MKQLAKNKKIMIIIIAIILIAGVAMTLIKGLKFDLKYEKAQRIQLYLEQEVSDKEIKQITDEVFGEQEVIIQKVELYRDTVAITSKEITEEQKNNLITKVNEKYGLELDAEETEITNIPHTRGRDIVKPFIKPFIISSIIVLAYIAIRYYKLSSGKVVVHAIAIVALSQAVLLSIMAIARISVGRLTIPMVLAVYMLSLVGVTSKFEKQLAKKVAEEE